MKNIPLREPNDITDISQLISHLPGKVVLPSDSQYDAARQAWNLVVDQRPELIVYAESPLDVAKAMSFARQNGLEIAVQCTGHGIVQAANGAMLINTSRMKDLRIDPEAQTAWVGAGVKWGEVLEHSQQHGLAPLLGSSPNVGAVGYSLGGGMGWLARKYGMSADSIIHLDIVTPDGIMRRANPKENGDLFWALRGGGGGFGVVTGMEIRLYPLARVYAGNLYYPSDMAKEVFQRFREWAEDAPDELTASVVLMNFPPHPETPPIFRGQSFVIVRGCYCGPVEDGEKLMEYWRLWRPPTIDDFKTIPFLEAASISQDPIDPVPVPSTGAWLSELSDEAAETLIRYTLPQDGPPTLILSEVRLAGGAISRQDPEASAYSHRDGQWLWISAGVAMGPEMLAQLERHYEQMRGALSPYLTGKLYMNFADGKEARLRTRDGFSEENFQRLKRIKARYDPDRRFNFSFDIPPLPS
jgi:FAD/FMN-containing dehydrogenase